LYFSIAFIQSIFYFLVYLFPESFLLPWRCECRVLPVELKEYNENSWLDRCFGRIIKLWHTFSFWLDRRMSSNIENMGTEWCDWFLHIAHSPTQLLITPKKSLLLPCPQFGLESSARPQNITCWILT